MRGDGLGRFPLLADLGPADLEVLEPYLETRGLESGAELFSEGQDADGLWLVRRGKLKIESQRAGDLGRAGPGSAVGALSLAAIGPREATAVAASETELLFLSRTAFRRLMDENPRSAGRLLEGVVRDAAGSLRQGLDRLA